MLLEARVAQPTTEAEVIRLAREVYGLEVFARALPGEYDGNFHLTALDGRAFVLKVMHPARERSFIDLQCKALVHLAGRAPRLSLPRVIPCRGGELFTQITGRDGSKRLVWLVSFVKGIVLAKVHPHSPELLRDLGRFLGEVDAALESFEHPAAHCELKWDSSRAAWIKEFIPEIEEAERRALVEKFLALYEAEVVPRFPHLRRSVIYGDANDYNVLVSEPWPQPRRVVGVIDFGDMHHGLTVSEVAIAAAYAILGKVEPLKAAAEIVSGYQSALRLEEEELAVLYTLIGARLAVSVTNSAHRKKVKPDDAYVTVSEASAWEALERLDKIDPRLALYTFRAACGMQAIPKAEKIARWLQAKGKTAGAILDVDLRNAPSIVFDLGVGSTFLGANPEASKTEALTEKIFGEMKRAGAQVGVG
ncbi:MAG TPA: phosphotransferase, partial [Candidatus Acidoferrum sp.]|nr:phosphotransferase [Candidatus Acidoferrum sp.]